MSTLDYISMINKGKTVVVDKFIINTDLEDLHLCVFQLLNCQCYINVKWKLLI